MILVGLRVLISRIRVLVMFSDFQSIVTRVEKIVPVHFLGPSSSLFGV